MYIWAALVAQLVRASVRSAECRGFKSHLRQLIFIFSLPQVSVFLSFFLSLFLSFHPSQVLSYIIMDIYNYIPYFHVIGLSQRRR